MTAKTPQMTTPLTLTTRGPAGSGWNCSPYGPDSPHNVYHAPISLLGLAQDNHQSVNGEYLARAWTWAGHQRYDNAGQSSPSVAHGALHFPSVQSSSSRLVALTETHPVYDTDSCETSAQSSQPFSPSITSLHRQLPPPNITTLQPSPTSRDAAKFVGVGQGKIKLEAQHASPTASHSAFSSHPRHGIGAMFNFRRLAAHVPEVCRVMLLQSSPMAAHQRRRFAHLHNQAMVRQPVVRMSQLQLRAICHPTLQMTYPT